MILDDIIANKKVEVQEKKGLVGIDLLKAQIGSLPPLKSFKDAIKGVDGLSLIGEIKKASPSAGVLRADFNPGEIARVYKDCGARAISVLTDKKYFQGSFNDLEQVRQEVSLPILRKDFIIDEYQIYKTRVLGASGILLIVGILSDAQLSRFIEVSGSLGLTALVEVHDKKEISRAVNAGAEVIGINNRDLRNLKVNIKVTKKLRDHISDDKVVVAESGINTRKDLDFIKGCSVDAVLIGGAFMKSEDIAAKVREIFG